MSKDEVSMLNLKTRACSISIFPGCFRVNLKGYGKKAGIANKPIRTQP